MNEEIIKKIFETVYVQIQSEIAGLEKTANKQHEKLQEREKAIVDIITYTTELIRKILAMTAGLEAEKKAQALEAGLGNMVTRLNEITRATHDDTLRAGGASNALASVTAITAKGYTLHDSEIEKAREIQQKQASGTLDQKRKLGTRPEKLKDIRNYALDEKDE